MNKKQVKFISLNQVVGRPVAAIDLTKDEERRKREMFMKAFEDLPKPELARCRCIIEPKELKENERK